jgi:glycosyltransferase involved in cell wall biosynthesis
MRVLFIAPLPPPVTGHSLAAKVFLDELSENYQVEVINLSKDSFKQGVNSLRRIIEVLVVLKKVWLKKKKSDIVYLTIAESFAGNIRDLLIYLICFGNLSKMYIHLHGGSLKKLLFDRYRVLAGVNYMFIKKLAGVVVTGRSHVGIFEGLIDQGKIHIVANFAQDHLFSTEKEISEKFSNIRPLRVLFVGCLIPQKGFNELAEAYFLLDADLRKKVSIDFAGQFESESSKKVFLDKISGIKQIRYHGVVNNMEKKALFSQAHVFCLPTSFFEGQPISILEAYAAGCVVLTTGQSGIRDVFLAGLNGFEIQDRSSESIKMVLERIIVSPMGLDKIAILNRNIASEKYRTSIYCSTLTSIIESQFAGADAIAGA